MTNAEDSNSASNSDSAQLEPQPPIESLALFSARRFVLDAAELATRVEKACGERLPSNSVATQLARVPLADVRLALLGRGSLERCDCCSRRRLVFEHADHERADLFAAAVRDIVSKNQQQQKPRKEKNIY